MNTAVSNETRPDRLLGTPEHPRVSVIIPARNEERDIGACVRSILSQDVADAGLEVIVADGCSIDGTVEAARRAGATVVANPDGSTPAGLNAALVRCRGDVVVRFDAHAEMPAGYIAACLGAMDRHVGPVCVGGWRRVAGRGPWGRATALALASRFGVGNPRLWRSPDSDAPVEVETVALGCWSAEELRAIGGWSERFHRNQDFELNHRFRRAGGRVIFDPRIWSVYKPRESPTEIARQYWDYGRFKALMLAEAPASLRPRQLAPIALLATLGAAALPGRMQIPARTALGGYTTTLALISLRSRVGWRTAAVIALMHLTWGAGLVVGSIRLRATRG
jgi:glycosyltransferase involved in cell wall biosynthesis